MVDKEKSEENIPIEGEKPILDPWGSGLVGDDDYDRLIEEFGIERIDVLEIPYSIFEKNRFLRRKIIFGQQDLKDIIEAVQKGKPWAVMSGIKPSGHFHLGTLTTASEIVEFQRMGGKVYYAIADMESYFDNGMSYEDSFKYAVDNLADILTLGLDPDNAYIWLQSREEIVNQMPFKAGRYVTANTMKAIYGDKPFALYMAALVQAGDILLPQIRDEIMPTVVPVGIDQAPHLRLVRDITRHFPKIEIKEARDKKGRPITKEIPHKLFKPGSTYHKLMPGLDDITKKMSKSRPNSYFNMDDTPKKIRKKIMGAFTGGRNNMEEHKKLGGIPENCMIYKILEYHFQPDDNKLQDRYLRCRGGMMCGVCKKEVADIVLKYVEQHNEKKKSMIPIAEKILSAKH
jgi:tryptophanyl-tRNA synthetase